MKKKLTGKELGEIGEKIAKKFLKKKGLKFITSNFKYNKKEVDLIFLDKKNKILIFAEVKARNYSEYFFPEQAVDSKKISGYRYCIEGFLKKYPRFYDYDVRIDSLGVTVENLDFVINHTENLI
jgi:putative endonuclease